jgi:beta-glucanase (GH16 family)
MKVRTSMSKLPALLLCAGMMAVTAAATHAQSWSLVWADEFDRLDTSNWTFEVGGDGWGNHELQYYTNGANTSVSGGVLTITAARTSGLSCWYGSCQYTSSRMITRGKREFRYGRLEARIAVPMGQGLWPAFWMLGSNIGSVGWPACGESDILEHVNNETQVHGTIHWDAGGHASYSGAQAVSNLPVFHVYSIEWTPSYIRWFVDGVQYHEANILNSINSTEEFHRPFFILLNLAVGGDWPGSPDGSTAFPARMQVDYVRVYQQVDGGISPTAWYTIVNQNSAKCADGDGWGIANGTRVIQWACGNGQFNQEWQFVPTDSGYYRVVNRNAARVLDVSGGPSATGNNALVHLWEYVGGTNQQWRPESIGGGLWRFRARHSNRCLDVPGSSTLNGVQLQQYDCNGTGAQSFRLVQQP